MSIRFREALASRGRPFVTIRGGWDERLALAMSAVERLLSG